jgi:hypothetical protein
MGMVKNTRALNDWNGITPFLQYMPGFGGKVYVAPAP